MPDAISVKIEGGEALARALKRLGPAAAEIMGAAVVAGGRIIAAAANPLAPEPQIEVNLVEQTKTRAAAEVGPPQDKWYWRFIETGAEGHEIRGTPLAFEGQEGLIIIGRVDHPGMAAHPFLRPAFDNQRENATDKIGDSFKSAVKK